MQVEIQENSVNKKIALCFLLASGKHRFTQYCYIFQNITLNLATALTAFCILTNIISASVTEVVQCKLNFHSRLYFYILLNCTPTIKSTMQMINSINSVLFTTHTTQGMTRKG